MEIPQNIHLLIDKYLSGSSTKEERNQLHEWYRSIDHDLIEFPTENPTEEQDIYQRMLSKIDAGIVDVAEMPKPKLFKWYRLIAAAVILVVGSVGGYLFINSQNADADKLAFKNDIAPASNKTVLKLANGTEILLDDVKEGEVAHQGGMRIIKNKEGQLTYDLSAISDVEGSTGYNTIVTPIGGQFQVLLPDGTKAWLNAASSLRFPTYFGGKDRNVETSGEVYFEVAKNKSQPFKVQSSNQSIEVLGTHFNVNAYGDEGNIKTTLLEGRIKIKATGNPTETILKPGQQSQISKTGSIDIIDADVEEIMAWKNNLFLFNNTPIEQVMLQVTRWYDIDLVYKGTKPNLSFTGVVPKNNNISILLKVLESTGGVQFGIEGNKVIIQSSPINKRRI